jgi:hypothetical protein
MDNRHRMGRQFNDAHLNDQLQIENAAVDMLKFHLQAYLMLSTYWVTAQIDKATIPLLPVRK